MKKIIYIVFIFVAALVTVNNVSAHVVVLPKTAPSASYQTFTMGVPVEKDMATVGVRLIVPEGVTSARPNVKLGWNINTVKEVVDGKEVIKEIIWTGGTIPLGFRDEFIFSAKTPKEGKVIWKAYQTYSDGTVVAWDADPGETHDHAASTEGPASVTEVTESNEHGLGHGSAGASHGFGHDMLLPLLALGISLACVIEIGKIHRKKA